MPVISTIPNLPAINPWIDQVKQRARQLPPHAAMALLHGAGAGLLERAAQLHASPNWAESYVEGTWMLADDYAILGQRLYGAHPGWTRLGVTARWRTGLSSGKLAALDRAVPHSFRNTSGVRVHNPVLAPR